MPETTTTGSSTNIQTPYEQARRFNYLIDRAKYLATNYPPKHYGVGREMSELIAPMNADQLAAMGMTRDFATSGMAPIRSAAESGFSSMMSGRVDTGPGSPYGEMMDVYRRQAMDQAQQAMSELRSSQVSYQPGGSSRGDLLNQQVLENVGQSIADVGAGMYMNAYNTAQQQQANALSQYANMLSTPMNVMRDYYNRVGVPLQQQAQAERDMSREIFDYQQMAPWEALRMYQALTSGNMGGMSTTTESGRNIQNV